jgi:hypothetical protein
MEAAGYSETMVPFYKTTRRHIPQNSNLHIHLCNNPNLTGKCPSAEIRKAYGKGKTPYILTHDLMKWRSLSFQTPAVLLPSVQFSSRSKEGYAKIDLPLCYV